MSHLKHVHHEVYRTEINAGTDDSKSVAIKRLQLIQHCAEIVAINGRPFSYLMDSGFKGIIEDQLEFLRRNNASIEMSYPFTEIKEYISQTAMKMQKQIKAEVRGTLVSTMIDIGSRNSWSILSIYIQYAIDGYVKVRNLGMLRMKKRHTADYIYELVLQQLKRFDITKSAMVSFTTDNANNMRSAIRLFDDDIGAVNDDQLEEIDSNNEPDQMAGDNNTPDPAIRSNTCVQDVDGSQSNEIRDLVQQYDIISNDGDDTDRELDIILDDDAAFRDTMASVEMNIAKTTLNVGGVPCAAHTLQLAVKDALKKSSEANDIISLCRLAAKLLRRETSVLDLQSANIFIKVVRLDCEVRWNSIYLMVRNE